MMANASTKHEIENFDGTNDFGLWKIKMLAHLGNLGLDETLEGEAKMSATYNEKKKDIMKLWLKLESLYMTKICPIVYISRQDSLHLKCLMVKSCKSM